MLSATRTEGASARRTRDGALATREEDDGLDTCLPDEDAGLDDGLAGDALLDDVSRGGVGARDRCRGRD